MCSDSVSLDRTMSFYEGEEEIAGSEPVDASDICKNLLDELTDDGPKLDAERMLPPPPSFPASSYPTSTPMQVYLRIRPLKDAERNDGEDQVSDYRLRLRCSFSYCLQE